MSLLHRLLPVAVATVVAASATSVSAQGMASSWIWSGGYWGWQKNNEACEDLAETTAIRVAALEAIAADLEGQLNTPGLTRREIIELRVDLRRIGVRIAVIESIGLRSIRNPRACEVLEAKVIRLASFPF